MDRLCPGGLKLKIPYVIICVFLIFLFTAAIAATLKNQKKLAEEKRRALERSLSLAEHFSACRWVDDLVLAIIADGMPQSITITSSFVAVRKTDKYIVHRFSEFDAGEIPHDEIQPLSIAVNRKLKNDFSSETETGKVILTKKASLV